MPLITYAHLRYASIEETLYLISSPANATGKTESIERLRQGQGQLRELSDVPHDLEK